MENNTYYRCRMCTAKDENVEFYPLFGKYLHLKNKFEKCFHIPINDPGISFICPRCAEKLIEIVMIYDMVHESNVLFTSTGSQSNQSFTKTENSNEVKSTNNVLMDQDNSSNLHKDVEQAQEISQSAPHNLLMCSEIRQLPLYSESVLQSSNYHNSLKKRMNTLRNGSGGYSCFICKNYFSSEPNLRHHFLTTHTRIRRYQCSVCFACCKSPKDIKVHMRVFRHHQCIVCKQSFFSYKMLKKHRWYCGRSSTLEFWKQEFSSDRVNVDHQMV